VEEITLTLDQKKTINPPITIGNIKLQLVSLWISDNEKKDLEFKTEIISPDNKSLGSNISRLNTGDQPRFRSIINIQGLKIAGEGRHIIRIMTKKNEESFVSVAEVPIDIKILYKVPNFSKEVDK